MCDSSQDTDPYTMLHTCALHGLRIPAFPCLLLPAKGYFLFSKFDDAIVTSCVLPIYPSRVYPPLRDSSASISLADLFLTTSAQRELGLLYRSVASIL